jgi:spore photoproduct lyase
MSGLQELVLLRFPWAGPNKRQELVRLVYEIAKREKISPDTVLASISEESLSFEQLKHKLVKRRFPELASAGIIVNAVFPVLDISPDRQVDTAREAAFSPERIFIEESVSKTDLSAQVGRLFPRAQFRQIKSYKQFVGQTRFTAEAYNQRTKELFIVREAYDYYKPCPCSPGVLGCGYHNVNLGFGCPYECSYCFLQSYTNAPGIVLPANIDDFFSSFAGYRKAVRVGSGETTDSLAFDHLTGFSGKIVDFFRGHPESVFEFKTKSANVQGLLAHAGRPNIVAAWSVNPQTVIDREEFLSAGLLQRIEAAAFCARAGYRTAFHFDPVFYYPGWEGDYADVVKAIASAVPSASMAWISLGTLRMTFTQKKMIENRFPCNTILDAELLPGSDRKLRYHESVRLGIYRVMLSLIREKFGARVPVYLCMEPLAVWRSLEMPLEPIRW